MIGDGARLRNHDRRQPTGCHDRGQRVQFLTDSIDQAINLTREPVKCTRLKRLYGVLPYWRPRSHQLNLA